LTGGGGRGRRRSRRRRRIRGRNACYNILTFFDRKTPSAILLVNSDM
jgi:hypothetical protein